MRELLDPEDIANDIRMDRSQHFGAFLLVEGHTDARVYRNFIKDTDCQIVIANNKDNAIKVLAILEKDRFAGILAIVDADFDRLESRQPFSSNLHFTDTHDLETLIIQSAALEKVLVELGSENKIAVFTSNQPDSLRSALLEISSHLGYLRWHSLRRQLNLKFEFLTFSKFLDGKTLAIDTAKLVKTVRDHSGAHHLNEKELQEQLLELQDEGHDLWQVCCGHDLVEILSVGLRKTLGSNDAKQVEPEIVSRALRLAYEFHHFCASQLYAAVKGWEKLNLPFQVFKERAL